MRSFGGAVFTALAIRAQEADLLERSSVLADSSRSSATNAPKRHAEHSAQGPDRRCSTLIPATRTGLIERRSSRPYWTDGQFPTAIADIIGRCTCMRGGATTHAAPSTRGLAALVSAGGGVAIPDGPDRGRTSRWNPGSAAAATPSTGSRRSRRRSAALPTTAASYVAGRRRMRTYESYPPVGTAPPPWHRQRAETSAARPKCAARRFRWDRTDPTPDFGGSMLDATCGLTEPTGREARPDGLVSRASPGLALRGSAGLLTIRSRTSRPLGDVFVRLCDVDEKASRHVCAESSGWTGCPVPMRRCAVR